jgi:hypothetical protein
MSIRYRRYRETLEKMSLPCGVCGRAIDYSQPYAFVAGHIVARHIGRRLGWSEAEINALANLRPEFRRCSNRTGTNEGNRAKRATRQAVPSDSVTTHTAGD